MFPSFIYLPRKKGGIMAKFSEKRKNGSISDPQSLNQVDHVLFGIKFFGAQKFLELRYLFSGNN